MFSKDTWSKMLRGAEPILAKHWKQGNYLPEEEKINTFQFIKIMDHFSAMRTDELWLHETTQTNFRDSSEQKTEPKV